MKTVIRIFNFIILGISGLAIALLFMNSAFSFNSRLSFDTDFIDKYFHKISEQINMSIPATETDPILKEPYIGDVNFAHVLGVDHINLSVKFDISFTEANTLMGKTDKELINQELIEGNVSSVFVELHEPVEILTEYTVRTVLRGVAKKEVYKQIVKALDANPQATSSATDVMEEVGMNENYFRGFAKALYDAANTPDNPEHAQPDDGCSIDSFVDVIFNRLKSSLAEAGAATGGEVSEESLTPAMKDEIKSGFITIINEAGLIQEDGQTFIRVNQVSYVFLGKLLRDELMHYITSDPDILNQQPGETKAAWAERLSKLYIETILPDTFYQIVGYVCLGLFIGIIVFAAIWAILFLITIARTFSSEKPWTIFGPWFWIFGSLQVVLGLGLTIFCKFYLPGFSFVQNALSGTPIQNFAIAPRTACLIPSMIFLGMIVFAIVYTIIAHSTKKEYKQNRRNRSQKPKEVIINE